MSEVKIDLGEVAQTQHGTDIIRDEIDNDILNKITTMLKEAENSAKAVWEIDETTVYVRDMNVSNHDMRVDWFTFDETINRDEMGQKVESLARKLYQEESKCSLPLFSRICCSIKSIFGSSGRT